MWKSPEAIAILSKEASAKQVQLDADRKRIELEMGRFKRRQEEVSNMWAAIEHLKKLED